MHTENTEKTEQEISTKPVVAPIITKVTVETSGVDYGIPETENYFEFDDIFNMFMQSYMQSGSTVTAE